MSFCVDTHDVYDNVCVCACVSGNKLKVKRSLRMRQRGQRLPEKRSLKKKTQTLVTARLQPDDQAALKYNRKMCPRLSKHLHIYNNNSNFIF